MRDETGYISEALAGLVSRREQEQVWSDKDVAGVGILKTMEGISCFTSPAVQLGRIRQVDREFKLVKLSEDRLLQDLDEVLEAVSKVGYSPAPYLTRAFNEIGVGYSRGVTDFTDTASFVVTTLLGSLVYLEKALGKVPKEKGKYQTAAMDAVAWLLDNCVLREDTAWWCWGALGASDASVPSVYFTWSAVVALVHALSSPYKPLDPKEEKRARAILSRVVKWAERIIVEDGDYPGEGRYKVSYARMRQTEGFDEVGLLVYIGSIFENVSGVDIAVSQEKEKAIVNTLLDVRKKDELGVRFIGGDHYVRLGKEVGSGLIQYPDRSIDFLLLSVLSWLHAESKDLGRGLPLSPEKAGDLRVFIEECKDRIVRDRSDQDRLWRRGAFLLYFTQRAVDALIDYIRYVLASEPSGPSLEEALVQAAYEAVRELIEENQVSLAAKIRMKAGTIKAERSQN